MMAASILRALTLAAALLLGAGAALAQGSGCTKTTRPDPPPRDVIACPDGLTITVERGAAYRLLGRDPERRPEGTELTDKGVLVESPAGKPRRFQINTPHVIAAVRGTVWAVDVGTARTSVFVERGAVAVRRSGARRGVTLRAGDGVDVEPGNAPLEVKRWPAQRAAALLARFARR